MIENDPDLEQRLSRFEAQLDRFSLTFQQWQQSQGQIPSGALHDVDQRVRALEETVSREAQALKRLHEEPLQQLQKYATTLRDICLSASKSVDGLDQTESRLAALQTDLHLHLSELTRNLQALVADLRVGTSTTLSTQGPPVAWPLERVMHLHDELRRGAQDAASGSSDIWAPAEPGKAAVRAGAVERDPHAGSPRMFAQEIAAETEEASHAENGRRRRSPLWYGAVVAAAVVVGVAAFAVERRIESRLNDAVTRVTAAERQAAAATDLANRQAASAREEADREIAEARQSAERAETIGAILTAPDLVRFNLTGGPSAERSSAQVLWSRTRGFMLSASRLPAAPPESVYQLWFWTNGEPVSGGLFLPDATGRATLVTGAPLKVLGPVVGAAVTVEPSGGRVAPSGPTVLTRLSFS
jgi:hypothetical protein